MNNDLNMGQLVALLIPLVLVELGLLAFALYDLIKRKHVRGGNKWLWGIIIVVVEFFGPILYFVLGREEE
jgi:hypothetical protein